MRGRLLPGIVGLLAGCLLLAGCQSDARVAAASTSVAPVPTPATTTASPTSPTSSPAASGPTKVMVIAEENETYEHVLGGGHAPYLSSLAQTYATAANMDAGYPTYCPSLAAYLLMTSGQRDGVCDDAAPAAHPIKGDNVFQQVATSGQEWRNYAEAMPGNCYRFNSGSDFLIRHAPAAYYTSEKARCAKWMVPLGTFTKGALHDDVAAGTLPAYSFVTPDACDDMHGAPGCEAANIISGGDAWLKQWMKQIMAGPDYRDGKLLVFVTWDEGDASSNHIPLLAIAPGIHHRTIERPLTQCDMLRTTEDLLHLPALNCAAKATSLAPDLGLS